LVSTGQNASGRGDPDARRAGAHRPREAERARSAAAERGLGVDRRGGAQRRGETGRSLSTHSPQIIAQRLLTAAPDVSASRQEPVLARGQTGIAEPVRPKFATSPCPTSETSSLTCGL